MIKYKEVKVKCDLFLKRPWERKTVKILAASRRGL